MFRINLSEGTPKLDSFLDRLFAWFREPKEEAPMHEEHAPHEAAEERPSGSEEHFHDFSHEERVRYEAPEEHPAEREERFGFRHEEHARYEAAEEHEAESEEPEAVTFAKAAGLHKKKELEA